MVAKSQVKKYRREGTRHLEVFFEIEVSRCALFLCCEYWALSLLLLLCARHDTSLLVVTNPFLEEVGLASQRDILHEVEGVGSVVALRVAKGQQQAVGNKLDVLAHKSGVHAEQSARKSVRQELLLNCDSFSDDSLYGLFARAIVQQREEEAGKVCMHALIAGNEFVGECKTGHQAALLQPKDGCERATEEDTLDGSERHEAVGEGRILVRDPSQSPVSFLTDAGN